MPAVLLVLLGMGALVLVQRRGGLGGLGSILGNTYVPAPDYVDGGPTPGPPSTTVQPPSSQAPGFFTSLDDMSYKVCPAVGAAYNVPPQLGKPLCDASKYLNPAHYASVALDRYGGGVKHAAVAAGKTVVSSINTSAIQPLIHPIDSAKNAYHTAASTVSKVVSWL